MVCGSRDFRYDEQVFYFTYQTSILDLSMSMMNDTDSQYFLLFKGVPRLPRSSGAWLGLPLEYVE